MAKTSEKILIEVSNRHAHLSRKHIDLLFGKNYELKKLRSLSLPRGFAAEEKITLINNDNKEKRIEGVRIVGPERKQTQIELLKSDAEKLDMKIPERESGDIENTPGILIKGFVGEVLLEKGVLLAKRHLHISSEKAEMLGLKDKSFVKIKADNIEITNVLVRITDDSDLVLHIDKDEAKELGIEKECYGEIVEDN